MLISDESPDDFVKVVDFGLARLLNGRNYNQHLTRTNELIGSVYYMSPEQCKGQQADHRSDIYSLGCVLYEALCGEPPLVADNPIGILSKHVNEMPRLLSSHLELSAEVDAVIFKAMAKSPADRYQSMEEFGCDLRALLPGSDDDVVAPAPKFVAAQTIGRQSISKRTAVAAMGGGAILLASSFVFLESDAGVSAKIALRYSEQRNNNSSGELVDFCADLVRQHRRS